MSIANAAHCSMMGGKWKNPYDTANLLCMLDGEWNAGGGVHNDSLRVSDWCDLSGNGNNATGNNSEGTITFGSNYALFDGAATSAAKIPNQLGAPANISVEVVYEANTDYNRCIVGCTASGCWSIWPRSSSRVDYYARGYAYPLSVPRASNEDGLILSRGFTAGPTQLKAYRNGVVVGTTNGSAIQYTTTWILIGGDWGGASGQVDSPLIGKIYNFRAYLGEISEETIVANNRVDHERFGVPLIA